MELGEGVSAPMHGFASLSRTLELAISISPLILFTPRKLSSIHFARTNLVMASGSYSYAEIYSSAH
jgi:hypothetical protein